MNDEELKLSKDEFTKLNWKIRSKLSKINSEEHNFLDDNDVETIEKEKNKKVDVVKRIKKVKCLFIDDDNNDVETIEKNDRYTESLFIDDDVKTIKKNNNNLSESLFIDEVKPIKKKKRSMS